MKRRLLFIVLSLLCAGPVTQALELGLGLTAVEEGDDRFRPAVMGHAGFGEKWFSSFYYYGRNYGPIVERTYVLNIAYRLDVFRFFGTDFMHAGFGVALMNEMTALKFAGDSANSSTEDATNLGFMVGAYADIPVPGPVFMRFGMESHYFLAGLDGAMAMSTGRKEMLSLVSGVKF